MNNTATHNMISIINTHPHATAYIAHEGKSGATMIIMRGLPGSGKSTIAHAWIGSYDNRVIISRDDIRHTMFHYSGVGTKEQESVITTLVEQAIDTNISAGHDVIIDQTLMRRSDARGMGKIGVSHDATVMYVNVDVDVDTAMSQMQNRADNGGRYVSPDVISNMHKKFGYLKNQSPITSDDIALQESHDFAEYQCHNPHLSPVVLFDIDGTLALMEDRSAYDWDKVGEDKPNIPVVNQLRINREAGNTIIIFSGRDDICREDTEAWLHKHDIKYDLLMMRKHKDNRKDSLIKREMLTHVEQNYGQIVGIFDDRNQVVDMYRSIGLPVFQVNYGDF